MKEAVYEPAAPAAGTMRAARLVEPGRIDVVDAPLPDPAPGQAVIEIEGCGVCASNIPPWEGREWFSYPMERGALGHEAWGRVSAVGEGLVGFGIGDRVAFLGAHSYATHEAVEAASVVRLPNELDGRPFPGEPLGCAMNIFRRSEVRSGDTVGIIGIGFLGSLLTRLCADAGARVIAMARKPSALRVAERMGAHERIALEENWQAVEQVRGLTDGRLCDIVMECVGKQGPLELAGELAKERGRLVIAGYHQDGLRQVNLQLWNWRGLDVINAHEREQRVYIEGIREAVEAVSSGRVNPDPLYTHRFPLHRLDEALNLTKERPDGFMKALVMVEGQA